MSKRLQVILQDPEYREIQRAARAGGLTLAAWVRQALRAARSRQPLGDVSKKLEAVRVAVRYDFPASNIAQMLSEIELGYVDDPSK